MHQSQFTQIVLGRASVLALHRSMYTTDSGHQRQFRRTHCLYFFSCIFFDKHSQTNSCTDPNSQITHILSGFTYVSDEAKFSWMSPSLMIDIAATPIVITKQKLLDNHFGLTRLPSSNLRHWF